LVLILVVCGWLSGQPGAQVHPSTLKVDVVSRPHQILVIAVTRAWAAPASVTH